MADFIDRAKLEALAEERYPMRLPYNRKFEKDAQDRVTFMAGVDAALALLGAETTEEWGVQDRGGGFLVEYDEEADARDIAMNSDRPGATISREVVSRRVLYGPWLPSEGGEKP